jgi:hypothetical protein
MVIIVISKISKTISLKKKKKKARNLINTIFNKRENYIQFLLFTLINIY